MAEAKNIQEQDLNQLLKVRREKLAALQAEGKDPFRITKYDMTHHSKDIKDSFDARRSVWRAELCRSVLWEKHPFATFRI